jgi:hypothetical protein
MQQVIVNLVRNGVGVMPAVHQMVLSLEKRGFIERTPGQGRSLNLLLSREQLPDLLGQDHDFPHRPTTVTTS